MKHSVLYFACGFCAVATAAVAWPSINIGPIHIPSPIPVPPHLPIPVPIPPVVPPIVPIPVHIPGTTNTPVGPIPTPLAPTVQAGVGGAANVVTATVSAATAPERAIAGVITGRENISSAARGLVTSQGPVIVAAATAVNETNANLQNGKIVAATQIGGNVGKSVLNIADGPTQYAIEFATTSAIEAGSVASGTVSPDQMVAAPLAAALRTAEHQYDSEAKSIPDSIKVRLAPFFPAAVIQNARWAVGGVSVSIPDLINQGRKTFQGIDNAVTVGHITVFHRDPADDLHWWAHELQHQVQYGQWGIDQFAYQYITACNSVETDAENKAQSSFPAATPAPAPC